MNSVSLAAVRRIGATQIIQEVLEKIPASASILVHFDIDVLADAEFPAAYFPHRDGFTMRQMAEVLGPVLIDSRVRLFEISEYSTLRDVDRVWIHKLVELLSSASSATERAAPGGSRI